MNSIRKLVFASVLSSSCVGCAVMNPYVHPRDENGRELTPEAPDFVGGIGEAVSYADQWRITYRKAAAQHTVMRNTSAAVILPLSAASLFYGITDHGSSDRIARMAIGSAGLYGANQFLTSEPRQTLYLEGAKALTCAIAASRPLMVTRKGYEAFETAVQALDDSSADLVQAATNLDGAIIDVAAKKPTTEDRKTELRAARTAAASANEAAADAKTMLETSKVAMRSIDLSGQTLYAATRAITDTVNVEIGKTQPNLDALKATVTGLSTLAGTFGQSHLPKPPTETTSKPKALADAVAKYRMKHDLSNKIEDFAKERAALSTAVLRTGIP